MSNSSPERNKAIALEAFETLFNKRDYTAAERFWSPSYIQHSAHIPPGREGLFNLVRSAPKDVALREPAHHRRGRLRHSAWPLHGDGQARRLDRGRCYPVRRRSSQRALGRSAGRGDQGRICEWASHVRRHISEVRAEHSASP